MDENDYEINLADYIKILFKNKALILSIFSSVVLISFVFSLLMPKIYQVSGIIFAGSNSANYMSVQGIISNIEHNVYSNANVVAENPKSTKLINLSLQTKDPDLGTKELNSAMSKIVQEYNENFNAYKQATQEKIFQAQKELSLLENRKLYADKGIADLELNILSWQEGIKNLAPMKIFKSATASNSPIKPRIKLNLAVASMLGIFLGIFIAFIKEWWKENI